MAATTAGEAAPVRLLEAFTVAACIAEGTSGLALPSRSTLAGDDTDGTCSAFMEAASLERFSEDADDGPPLCG